MSRIAWSRLTAAEVAALTMRTLRRHGLDAVLVGGACVTLYSRNRYESSDLDLVTGADRKTLAAALSELGFRQGRGRHFERAGCPFLLEFLSPPVAIGNEEMITQFARRRTRFGTITLLTRTDCVKDRLAAWFHWHDPQALEQALLVARGGKSDLAGLRRWARGEGMESKLAIFDRRLMATRKRVRGGLRGARITIG